VSYLLDTNACIAIINGRPPLLRDRFRAAVKQETAMSVSTIVIFELWYGIGKSQHRAHNVDRLRTFLSAPVEILGFDDEDGRIAGLERARLREAGTPIGPCDLLIAAQALRHRRTLVTANVDEFSRVRGLVWEDWAAGE
jgi:tRNA(fMet)-specific endonuclease VapC